MKLYYTAKTDNSKTGNIPTQWIGRDHAESRQSCTDTDGKPCPLLAKICYAHNGTVGFMGFYKIQQKARRGYAYSIWQALMGRDDNAKYVRFGGIGDPSAINKSVYTRHYNIIKSFGLGVISYTHFWRTKGRHLKGRAIASCDTWQEVKEAVSLGWRATWHTDNPGAPQGTKDGIKYTTCPAQRGLEKLGKRGKDRRDNPVYDARYAGVTCNTCGLCNPERKGLDLVVFLNH